MRGLFNAVTADWYMRRIIALWMETILSAVPFVTTAQLLGYGVQ